MKSKLGLHINGLWGQVDDWLTRAKPQVLLSMDHNPDHWAQLRAQLPGTFIIGRYGDINDGDAEFYPTDDDTPATAAAKGEHFFQRMLPQIQKMGGLYDAWVGINEPVCHTETHAKNLAAWHVRWGDLMKGVPMKSVAYTFSQGVPEPEHWGLLAEGLQHCDLLGLHEYWCPHWNSPDMIPWHTLRYRTAWDKLPASARRQIVITECGADGGAAGIPTDGWKHFVLEGVYLGDLQAYDAELQKDDYVIGATIFCAGGDWANWDVSTAWSIPGWIGSTGNPQPVLVTPPVSTAKPPVTKPVEPAKPPVQTSPELMKLAQARALVQQTIDLLGAGNGNGARDLMVRLVTPWFYATALRHTDDLPNAQAHTTARWFCEEATRQIESNHLNDARQTLLDHVLSWLDSPGPQAIGILGIAPEPKKKAAPKKVKAASRAKRAAPKKRAAAKKPSRGTKKPRK